MGRLMLARHVPWRSVYNMCETMNFWPGRRCLFESLILVIFG
jgi:hypothetical protein